MPTSTLYTPRLTSRSPRRTCRSLASTGSFLFANDRLRMCRPASMSAPLSSACDRSRGAHRRGTAATWISPQTKAPGFSPRRSRRRRGLAAVRSTCHRDVPSLAAEWRPKTSSRPARQSTHQNPRGNSQAQPGWITGRDWPYKATTCQYGCRERRSTGSTGLASP